MSEARWYYGRAGQQMGPVAIARLRELASSGTLLPSDLVWTSGMAQWQTAISIPELPFPQVLPLPPAISTAGQPIPYATPAQFLPGAHDIGQDPKMRMILPVGRSGWAIAAGYVGLFCLLIFPGPIALILSFLAYRDIRQHPDKHGMGRTIFGTIMGVLATGVLIMWVIAVLTRR